MPAASASTAWLRAASSGARRSSCSCSLSAVSGERSSCAASDTKARCVSNERPSRCSSALSALTSGDTSSGRSSVGSGASDCSSRRCTSAATARSGRSVSAATHHTTSAISGATSSSGTTLRSAALAASCWRICRGCATWITRSLVATLKVRHVCSPAVTSAKPSSARAGRSLWARDA